MIYTFRHKAIRQMSEPVTFPDESLEGLVNQLWDELAKSNNGIGIAANQIGILRQVGVIKFDAHKVKMPMTIYKGASMGMTEIHRTRFTVMPHEIDVPAQELVLINPVLISKENEYEVKEGCLSYPGIYADIKRFKDVKIINTKLDGTTEEISATGLLSQAIQHEMDHFSARCITDHFSPAQKVIYENRIKRIK